MLFHLRVLPSSFRLGLAALCAAAVLASCKNQEEQQLEQTSSNAAEATRRARAALADRHYQDAVKLLNEVTSLTPKDTTAWLLLAEAHKQAGNDAAAVLSLKTAESLGAKNDPTVMRARAELYQRMGQVPQAIAVLMELREQNVLTDAETLELAHLQAITGSVDAAWASLEQVQKRKPDDPEAKAIEAEILLLKGEEVLGARLLDRLVTETPGLASARVARAKYFLANNLPEEAVQDLSEVDDQTARKPEVAAVKARALNTLKRYDEAVALLQPLADAHPKDAELMALLAETLLLAGKSEEAMALVDAALGARPRFARALYVRGRSKEAQGDLPGATADFQAALKSDPGFAPALSRLWQIYEHQGQKGDAISTLERLFAMHQASSEEKLSLVGLYLEVGDNPTRARALVEEALKKNPGDARLKDLKARVAKMKTGRGGGKKAGGGVIIMKRGK